MWYVSSQIAKKYDFCHLQPCYQAVMNNKFKKASSRHFENPFNGPLCMFYFNLFLVWKCFTHILWCVLNCSCCGSPAWGHQNACLSMQQCSLVTLCTNLLSCNQSLKHIQTVLDCCLENFRVCCKKFPFRVFRQVGGDSIEGRGQDQQKGNIRNVKLLVLSLCAFFSLNYQLPAGPPFNICPFIYFSSICLGSVYRFILHQRCRR